MKVHPIAWFLVLIALVAPIVLVMTFRSENRLPTERFSFLSGADLESSYPPQYSRSLRVQRGNSYVYHLGDDPEQVAERIGATKGWRRVGTNQQGWTVFRHSDGPRAYVSKFVSDKDPDARSRVYFVNSIRRVGWLERQAARARFQFVRW